MSEERRATLRTFYEAIGGCCKRAGLSAYVPHLRSDPTQNAGLSPEQVYIMDRDAVLGSCLIVAYVGIAALGVGAEIEMGVSGKTRSALLREAMSSIRRVRTLEGLLRAMRVLKNALRGNGQIPVILLYEEGLPPALRVSRLTRGSPNVIEMLTFPIGRPMDVLDDLETAIRIFAASGI